MKECQMHENKSNYTFSHKNSIQICECMFKCLNNSKQTHKRMSGELEQIKLRALL